MDDCFAIAFIYNLCLSSIHLNETSYSLKESEKTELKFAFFKEGEEWSVKARQVKVAKVK